MIVGTEAVVLHSMKYRDTSKILTVYSRKFGKLKLIAKGARANKNKFGASLELMTNADMFFYKKEHRELHLLSKSEIHTPFNRLSAEPEKMFVGLAVIELVNMVMHDEDENEPMYLLLVSALKAIDETLEDPIKILFAFELKMFTLLGFGVDLRRCRSCKKDVGEETSERSVFFNLPDGTFTCEACSKHHAATGMKLSRGIVRSVLYLCAKDFEEGSRMQLSRSSQNAILSLLHSYLCYHVEGARTLRSLALL